MNNDLPEPGTIWVQCPECGAIYPTHDVGDITVCVDETCEKRFQRFQNIVDEPDIPDWECPNCGRLYDERPGECKCRREREQERWLWGESDKED